MHLSLRGAPMSAAIEEIKVRIVHRGRRERIDLTVISNQSQLLCPKIPSVKFNALEKCLPLRVPTEIVEWINKNSEMPQKIPNKPLPV
jgi:hypothetical protein